MISFCFVCFFAHRVIFLLKGATLMFIPILKLFLFYTKLTHSFLGDASV